MPDPVSAWLLGKASEEAYAKGRHVLTTPTEVDKIENLVKTRTGRSPGRRYRRWLRQPRTIANLTDRTQDARDQLIADLEKELNRGFFRNSALAGRAEQFVDATIAGFLQSLNPSLATAISDYRSEQRHAEVLDRIDAKTLFKDRLNTLPPNVQQLLNDDVTPESETERLVDALAKNEPRQLVASLIAQPPQWLRDAPAMTQLVLAELAVAYGIRLEAAELFERVGDLGLNRPQSYAQAAFQFEASGKADRRRELIAKAGSSGSDLYVDVVEAAIEDDWPKVRELLNNATALGDPFLAQAYALALQAISGLSMAIDFLKIASQAFPAANGISLQLARLLIERSLEPETTSRDRDLADASQLATRVRDNRRKWKGNSAEAVEIACRIAIDAKDFRRVIELGTTEPRGEARPEESSAPEVQFLVAQAAIASGDRDMAGQVAQAASGFRKALILADMSADSDTPPHEVRQRYEEAWELAETDDDKVAFWIGASTAGVDPLPGNEQLDQRTDDLPALVKASLHLAHDRADYAVALLRPNRNSESARRLLARAYIAQGKAKEAVTELIDAADQFNNPGHLATAVEILLSENEVAAAAPLAQRALHQIPVGNPRRALLHEVCVADANNRRKWRDMEQVVRAWIAEEGTDSRRSWMLVQALLNQGKHDAAWRIIEENRLDAEVASPLEAVLWIALHAEYAASSDTVAEALKLAERFPQDGRVRAAAVNAFFLMGSAKGELTPDELGRWQALIRLRAENPAPDDTFMSLEIPTDPDGLISTLRPLLEPQATLLDTWITNVRKGWPYGTLAMASGRSYTETLAQRAAGFVPIAYQERSLADADMADVLNTLDGQVIADLSVLTTAWYIKQRWPQLVGSFSRVALTPESLRDSARATKSMTPRSAESLSWDTRTGRPVIHRAKPEHLDRLREHTTWVHQIAASLPTHTHTATPTDAYERASEIGAWMATFEAARASGLTLWADDVGLRTLARNEGVRTFGTSALLAALANTGGMTNDQLRATIDSLRDEYVVDFPLDETWLINNARINEWRSGPGLVAFARPLTWANLTAAFNTWREVVSRAGKSDPMHVPDWLFSAVVGVASLVEASKAPKLVVGLTISATTQITDSPAAFAACVSAASAGCAEVQLSSQTETILRTLFENLSNSQGPTRAANFLANLGSELQGADRELLRKVLFNT